MKRANARKLRKRKSIAIGFAHYWCELCTEEIYLTSLLSGIRIKMILKNVKHTHS